VANVNTTPRDVLDFWFKEHEPKAWFTKDTAFDHKIRTRFLADVIAARGGAYDRWADTAQGTLALLILLDQFPRNIFRGHPDAFASDAKAREVTRRAIGRGFDLETPKAARAFFYLPFEHSEDMDDQDLAVKYMGERLDRDAGPESNYTYALQHRDAIARFGRFPGRNAALGRTNTPEEEEFLKGPQRF
jgi:uncharacterized protein (DUF924 family)